MINIADVTKGVEKLLNETLSGYLIERNAEVNESTHIATRYSGWIGIYRNGINYVPITTAQWNSNPKIDVMVQVASMLSGADCEDKLAQAEKDVLTALNSDRTLKGTVAMTLGYDIEYQYNRDKKVYFHMAVITIFTEVKASL